MVSTISKKFYDTCSLLKGQEKCFEENFYISVQSLKELENIKTSGRKDEKTKYEARHITRLLDDNMGKYNVISNSANKILEKFDIESDPDNIIMAHAYLVNQNDSIIFFSEDICCKNIGRNVFGLSVESFGDVSDDIYRGYVEKSLSEDDMAYFYSNLTENIYGLLTNQYLIIRNSVNDIVDTMKWNGVEYQNVKYANIKSEYFGAIKPYNGDIYQQCVLNSFSSNQVTMVKGSAGTGKSYLAMGFLFNQLEKHKIDKIIVFCNTVATNNSAKLGFYPGTRDEKLLDSQIGNMLGAKLGGIFAVQRLIEDGKLVLLPMSDIRGYDTSNMNAGVYITEAQNMDIDMMKLALQRIGEDCICIIDGDYCTQVDLSQYAGSNNGMRKMSKIFRGQDIYGEVELKNIYRSKIAAIAEKM